MDNPASVLPPPAQAVSRAKGIVCMLVSAAGFAFMAAGVRLCDDFGGAVSSFQKGFFRNAVAFAVALAVFACARRAGAAPRAKLSPRAKWLLLARSVAGTVGIFGHFYALSNIPVGEALALNKTAPFFTVLFSWLFLREKANRKTFLRLALAFAGVLLVMKPGLRAEGTFAASCGLVSGLGAGIAYTCVRELGVLGVERALIVLVFSAFSCVSAVPFILAAGIDPMTPGQIAVMFGTGAAAAVGQFGVTAAYRFAPSRDIAVFDYTSVVFASLLGFFLFGQVPDAPSVAGFALIVAAAALKRPHPRAHR